MISGASASHLRKQKKAAKSPDRITTNKGKPPKLKPVNKKIVDLKTSGCFGTIVKGINEATPEKVRETGRSDRSRSIVFLP